MPTSNSQRPIYEQLAEQALEGQPPDGEAMPSIRVLAASHLLNPLPVNRALQALGDEGLLEGRLALYVTAGARQRLLATQRGRFLQHEWLR
jgi:GntR family transcriptional regulator